MVLTVIDAVGESPVGGGIVLAFVAATIARALASASADADVREWLRLSFWPFLVLLALSLIIGAARIALILS